MEENVYPQLGAIMRLIFKVLIPCMFFTVSASPSTTINDLGKYLLNEERPMLGRITGFNAVLNNGEYTVSWGTVIETNVRQYDIEYSYDNKDFQRAGIVSANDRSSYSYNHLTTPRQSIFYRIKIVELNGSFAYSNTINVNQRSEKIEDYVMPTIVRDGVLSIVLNKQYRNLVMFDTGGHEVFIQAVGERVGRLTFTLPALPAGQYFIRLVASDTAVTRKVMLQ